MQKQLTTAFSKKKRSILMIGSAAASLFAFGGAAFAQSTAAGQTASTEVETVVVTGTSIRGINPVGTNTITLDRATLEATGGQTMQQMLADVPSVTGFGSGGTEFNQGTFGATGETLPTIHSLGASSSQSTLILIDGHPVVPGGEDGYSDPSILPTAALQRIDVLPDGASAIYGANAVAGVINFITRKDYEGFETNAQYGSASNFNNFLFSQIWGHQWDSGGVFATYEYKSNSHLLNSERSFSSSNNLTSRGGGNYDSFSCSPATIAATSSSNAYVYPYAASNSVGPATVASAAPCDYTGANTIVPSLNEQQGFVSFHQSLASWLTVEANVDYSNRLNLLQTPQASLTVTAFGPTGSSALNGTNSQNPFYVTPPGGSPASETVRWDPNAMVGPQRNEEGARAAFANTTWTADLGSDWRGTLDTVVGMNDSFSHTLNVFCSTCATLALNGTTIAAGGPAGTSSLADPYLNGTTDTVLRTLTTANALDVWDPAGSANKTSQSVLSSLKGNTTYRDFNTNMNDVRLNFTGPVVQLPGGPVRVAVGGEWKLTHETAFTSTSNSADPTTAGASALNYQMSRDVYSAFAEIYLPVIGPDMNIPLVSSLELDVAGRYDRYNDVGDTKNPKVGFTWDVVDGLNLKGNYGTSFTAPNIDALNPYVIASANPTTTSFSIPGSFSGLAGSFCGTTGCAVNGNTQQGVQAAQGNAGLVPARGTTYSLGTDFDLGALAGLNGVAGNVSYWQAKIVGGVTSPQLANDLTTPVLNKYVLLAPPGGWTVTSPAVINALKGIPITATLPSTIYYIWQYARVNAVNLQANGIDFATHYSFDEGKYGAFRVGGSGSFALRYDLASGIGAPYANYLNGHQNASVLHSIAFSGRASVNWMLDPVELNLFFNFVNPYWYPNSGTQVATGLMPSTGALAGVIYDKIAATETVDLNASYNLPDDMLSGISKGVKLTLDVDNVFNTPPPFLDVPSGNSSTTNTGFDQWHGNPIGRMVQVSITKKW